MTYYPRVDALIEAMRSPDEWVIRNHTPGTSELYYRAGEEFNVSSATRGKIVEYMGLACRLLAYKRWHRYLFAPCGLQAVITAHFAKHGKLPQANYCVVEYGLRRDSAMFYLTFHRDGVWRTVYDLNALTDHPAIKSPGHPWGTVAAQWDEIPTINFYGSVVGESGPVEQLVTSLMRSMKTSERDALIAKAKSVDSLLV